MRFAVASLLLALACCRERQADPKAVLACMSSQPHLDDYSLVTRCEPLGNSQTFRGTWFVGFETSLFKQGTVTSRDRGRQFHRLVVPSQMDDAVHKIDAEGYAAYEVVFLGRPSLLHLDRTPTTFVADKIVSMKRVPVQLPPV